MRTARAGGVRGGSAGRRAQRRGGFTLIELLIGATVMAVALLGVASMLPTGYSNVDTAAKMTMALTASRQMIEDTRTIPFDSLVNLDGFDSQNPVTLPAGDPERTIARRWRYALAGQGDGFTFTSAEKAVWATLSTATAPFGGRGRISVVVQSPTLRLVTVTVSIPGQVRTVQLATLVSKT